MTKSDEIRQCRLGAVHNPFQGSDKRVLFVCSMGLLRSPTGARLYANKYNTRSCGIWDDALIPFTEALAEWADEIVFVNPATWDSFSNRYKFTDVHAQVYDKAKVLNISDDFEHMHPELIKQFEEQYEKID